MNTRARDRLIDLLIAIYVGAIYTYTQHQYLSQSEDAVPIRLKRGTALGAHALVLGVAVLRHRGWRPEKGNIGSHMLRWGAVVDAAQSSYWSVRRIDWAIKTWKRRS